MINKLRRNFIISAGVVVFFVILVIVSAINLSNYLNMIKKVDERVNYLYGVTEVGEFARGEKLSLPELDNETKYRSRFFVTKVDFDGQIIDVDCSKITSVDIKTAKEMTQKILKKNRERAFYKNFRYARFESEIGETYIFLDCINDKKMFISFLNYSVVFSVLGFTVTIVVIILVSKKVFKPVKESYEKQKRFITNAGHELNTPLSIISANAQILAIDLGENEWLDGIEKQVERMNKLVRNLVYVAKMEERNDVYECVTVDLSITCQNVIGNFTSVADNGQKDLVLNIEKGVIIEGSEELLSTMFSMLIDNSIKYSTSEKIEISLTKEGKRACFIIKNGVEDFEKGEQSFLFERFYRHTDAKKKNVSGSGIGLSVVKDIVDIHKGKVFAYSEDGKSLTIKIIV